MLSGEFPFMGTEAEIMVQHMLPQYHPPSLTESRLDLPKGLDAIIEKAMAKEAEERFATAGELLRAFKAVVSPPSSIVTDRSPVDPPKPSPPPSPTVPSGATSTVSAEVVSVPPRTDPVPRESRPVYYPRQQRVLETRQSVSQPWYKKQIIRYALVVLSVAMLQMITSIVFVKQMLNGPLDLVLVLLHGSDGYMLGLWLLGCILFVINALMGGKVIPLLGNGGIGMRLSVVLGLIVFGIVFFIVNPIIFPNEPSSVQYLSSLSFSLDITVYMMFYWSMALALGLGPYKKERRRY